MLAIYLEPGQVFFYENGATLLIKAPKDEDNMVWVLAYQPVGFDELKRFIVPAYHDVTVTEIDGPRVPEMVRSPEGEF